MSWNEFTNGLLNLITVESDDEGEDIKEEEMKLLEEGIQNMNVSSSANNTNYSSSNVRNRMTNSTLMASNAVEEANGVSKNIKKTRRKKKMTWFQSLIDVSSSDEDDDYQNTQYEDDGVQNRVELQSIVIDTQKRNSKSFNNGIVIQDNKHETNSIDENENDSTISFDFDFDLSDDNDNSQDNGAININGHSRNTKEQYYDADKEYKKEFVLKDEHFIKMGIKTGGTAYERQANPQFSVLDVYIAFANTLVKHKNNEKKVNFQVKNDMEFWQWINEIVSSFSKYIHCELIFMIHCKKDNKIRRIVSSIHRSKKLRLVQKKYRHVEDGKWIFYHYKCSDEDKKKIFDFEYEKNNTEFNKWGFYLNFLLPDFLKIDNAGKKVFCSEEICHNLKETQSALFGDLQPYKIDPYNLSQYLLSKNNIAEQCSEPTPRKTRKMHE